MTVAEELTKLADELLECSGPFTDCDDIHKLCLLAKAALERPHSSTDIEPCDCHCEFCYWRGSKG